MGNYNIEPNEVVLVHISQVSDGGMSIFSNELILTNHNLISVKKNIFGVTKKVQKYPLNMVKIYNDSANVVVDNKSSGTIKLTIYFRNGVEVFGFSFTDANDVKKMANSINHIVTGSTDDLYTQNFNAMPGVALVAETLRGTFDTFKDAFGSKEKTQPVTSKEKVAQKCSYCGAPISGFKGQLVQCEYCDSKQQL
jgi:dissimilatory sulfite reductase (desulfoviridin) alpha/beta subunit